MKKRTIVLLLAALAVLFLAACGRKDPSPAVTTGAEGTAAVTAPSAGGDELPVVSLPAEDTTGPSGRTDAGTTGPAAETAPVTDATGTEAVTTAAASTGGPNETPEVQLPVPHTPTEEEARLLSLINEERAKAGAPALSFSSKYYPCAELRAREITKLFEHTRPNGGDCFTAYEACGKKRPDLCAENIATCSGYDDYVAQLHLSLMNSQAHRENILNPAYQTVSLCFARDMDGVWYLAELFQG
ncbi:MAG: hypothetical protein IJR89_03385 [Clostridia bacterium]|nr:hypothetical protein [Clostridia bacterium]